MARSGTATKERILDAAEALVFEHGFSATSLDRVLARTGLTKGAFFHHFASKAALGCALVERFATRDQAFLEECVVRAEKLASDPLQQVLILVGLLKEPLDHLSEPAAGCLFASYIYQPLEFTPEVAGVVEGAFLEWRRTVAQMLRRAAQRYPPREPVDCDSLADQLSVVVEGSYVLSKVLRDPTLPVRQLEHYRRYLDSLFAQG